VIEYCEQDLGVEGIAHCRYKLPSSHCYQMLPLNLVVREDSQTPTVSWAGVTRTDLPNPACACRLIATHWSKDRPAWPCYHCSVTACSMPQPCLTHLRVMIWTPMAWCSAEASSRVRWSPPSIEMKSGNLRAYEGSADQYLHSRVGHTADGVNWCLMYHQRQRDSTAHMP